MGPIVVGVRRESSTAEIAAPPAGFPGENAFPRGRWRWELADASRLPPRNFWAFGFRELRKDIFSGLCGEF